MSSAWSRLINFANGLISGQLPLANGGTAKALTAVNGGLVYSDADSLGITAAGTASQWVLSGGAGAPTMSNTTTTLKTMEAGAIFGTATGNSALTFYGKTTQGSTFTANGGGSPAPSASVTMVVQRVGDWVTLFVPTFNADSGTGSPDRYTGTSALPSWASPATTTQIAFGGITRNSGASSGDITRFTIATSGIVTLFRNASGSTFTPSTSCGLQTNAQLTYFVGTGS